jgi:hypothetical protein
VPPGSVPGPIVYLLHSNDCPVNILGPDSSDSQWYRYSNRLKMNIIGIKN